MKNIKIGPKLIASFLLTVALTAFIGIYLIISIESLNKQVNLLYEKLANDLKGILNQFKV